MKELLIAKIEEYISLCDADIQFIDSLFKHTKFRPNQIIHQEGVVCNNLWFIAKGLVRYTSNINGEDRTFIFRNEGDFIGDIEGFINRVPATKSIVTIEECLLYAISKKDLQVFYQKVTHGERFGRLLVENIFAAAVNHLVSFYTESPEQRYIKLIKQNKDFIQRIPQYHIASFLGIKPQSLCRIKKRLLSADL
ncbi:MAG: cyclic nucleotide-binding domain-containing protein [Bacteroidales bacterium]|nr:cyclic nucleotide-binding domain-containing protein [Bacteroidales bacterium]